MLGQDGKVSTSEFQKLLLALSEQYERDLSAALNSEERLRVTAQTNGVPAGKLADLEFNSKKASQQSAHSMDTDVISNISLPSEVAEVFSPKSFDAAHAGNDARDRKVSLASDLVSAKVHAHPMRVQSFKKMKTTKVITAKPYLEGTRVGKFIKSALFDKIVAGSLVANAIFIGVQVDVMFAAHAHPPVELAIIDYIFCIFFIAEIVLRMLGSGFKAFWVDPDARVWNWFDFIVVAVSTVDAILGLTELSGDQNSPLSNISLLRIIRIMRITRVLRVIRIMKFFRDLRILLAAIVSTVKTAYFALLLIFLIMYIFSVAITQLVADYVVNQVSNGTPVPAGDDLFFFFGSLADSLFTMFMTLAGGIDWKDAAVPLKSVGGLSVFLYVVFVIIMILCVLNVLTGIFCQCAIEASAADKDNIIMLQMNERQRYTETLVGVFEEMDESGDGRCSLEEFKAHIHHDSVQALLSSLDIEIHDALTLFEMLDFNETGDVDLDEFVTGCITLRGTAKAVQIEKVQNMTRMLTEQTAKMQKQLDQVIELTAQPSENLGASPSPKTPSQR